jgi:hypothetical protein
MLQAETFHGVDLSVGTSSVSAVSAANSDEKPVKEPVAADLISLKHTPFNIFIVPDVLMRSARLKRCVSLRSEPNLISWTATNPSENVEWRPMDKDTVLIPGLIVVSTGNNLEDMPLVRDTQIMARPDLALVCKEPENWYEQHWLDDFDEMKYNMELLAPRLGMYVVSRPEVSEDAIKKIEYQDMLNQLAEQEAATEAENATTAGSGINVVSVGFDTSRLEQFVEMLASLK